MNIKFSLILVILTLFTSCNPFKKSAPEIKEVTLFRDGKPQLFTDQERIEKLNEYINELDHKIDGVIVMPTDSGITKQIMEQMISKENGIELKFKGEHGQQTQFGSGKGSKHIEFTKVYIPLSGKYVKADEVVYFFGNKEGYGPYMPYLSNEGLKKIKNILFAKE